MNEDKPILSIETSGNLCGACVYISDQKYFEASINLKNSHSEKLFEQIDFVVKSSGIKLKDFKCVAVSAGPGSFTGLRIGMSAAKGLASGSGLPIVPVPTFEALAFQISNYLPEAALFSIANKVNVEELYYAKFKVKSNNYIFVENLQIIKKKDYQLNEQNTVTFGNSLVNSQSNFHRYISSPSPLYVAKWCKHFGDSILTFDYDYLEPNYLKNFIVKGKENV